MSDYPRSTAVSAGILLVLITASPAAAEVMDKEPTLPAIWLSSLLWTGIFFIAAQKHPLLMIVLLPFVPVNPALAVLTEIHDRRMGRAIYEEAGIAYIVQANVANALMLAGYVSGMVCWIKHKAAIRSAADTIA
jgi:NADH:ubiquinone oxidoreductase subunit 2 (subunit N)